MGENGDKKVEMGNKMRKQRENKSEERRRSDKVELQS